MDWSDRNMMAAQIAVREATQALLAAERRYHAAIDRPTHRLIYNPTKAEETSDADPDDIYSAAAAYGTAAADLREAYRHVRAMLKEHPNAG